MNFEALQPILALALGAVGTILGIINLVRDIRKSTVRVSVAACPVVRAIMSRDLAEAASWKFSSLNYDASINEFRNIGLWSIDALDEKLDSGVQPNLIGFEVENSSNSSVFIDRLGLAKIEHKKKFGHEIFDAIETLKANEKDHSALEIKPHGKFVTFLLLDALALEMVSKGYTTPVVEVAAHRKRFFGEPALLDELGKRNLTDTFNPK